MLWGYGRLFRWVPIILGCLARNWKIFHVNALLLFLKKEQCPCGLLLPPFFGNLIPHTRDLMKISQGRSLMNGKVTSWCPITMAYGFVSPVIARHSCEGSATAGAMVPAELRPLNCRG